MRLKPSPELTKIPSFILNSDGKLGPIEYRSPASLTPYVNNPRKHSEKQIVKLMASMEEFGFAAPVLVDKGGTIIAGEARIEAAKRLGLPEVPVLVADKWTKAQVRAYRLADNRLAQLSTWDDNLLAIEIAEIIEIGDVAIEITGWDTPEIDVLLDTNLHPVAHDPVDDVPPLPRHSVSRLGDLWNLGKHRLLCGSCLELENWSRLMDGKTAQMVFTDAPYNVRIQGNVSGLGKNHHEEFAQASGEMSRSEFTAFLTTAIGCATSHLDDGAVLDLCMDFRHLRELFDAIGANHLSLADSDDPAQGYRHDHAHRSDLIPRGIPI